ncbi:MAG: NAD(P)/FAD-dependent oxidoreductase [Ruminococcaceae bacterium]|nr:NAD(P)/FAD-dependent oxidoreductase [Oscillospiraceae bacterium]
MANILIIGAGVSGLTAGIYAQLHGHSATIYERHSKAGGNLTGWDRHGYHIDNCIHWLTGTNPVTDFYKMWEKVGALGEDIPVYQPQTLYTYEHPDGTKLSLCKDVEVLERDMLAISPADKKEIKGFVKAMRSLQRLQGMGGKDCERASNAWEKLTALPDLLKYYHCSVKDLADRFKHPVLKEFFLSFMLGHFSSLALIMVFATFTGKNGGIPQGSSCAMADRMVERYRSLGGALQLKNGISKINVQGKKAESVTLDDGTAATADYVIVTADPAVAFGGLLDRFYMPAKLAEQYKDSNMIRFSSTHCAFAYDGDDVCFAGDMMYEVPERYRELLCSRYLMMREFSHEKGFSPAGKSIIQTMAYCLEDDAKALVALHKDKAAYQDYKQRMSRAVEEIICRRMPALSGKLTCIDTWTPATYQRFVGSEVGSFMSFIMPAGSVPGQLSGNVPGLDNVVLATQWQRAPGGLPIAAMSGIDAVKLIDKREKRK